MVHIDDTPAGHHRTDFFCVSVCVHKMADCEQIHAIRSRTMWYGILRNDDGLVRCDRPDDNDTL